MMHQIQHFGWIYISVLGIDPCVGQTLSESVALTYNWRLNAGNGDLLSFILK